MKLLRLCSLFFLLAAGQAWAQAQDANPAKEYATTHLAAAERVIYAMALPERFILPTRQLLKNSLEKDPENAPLMSATMEPYLEKQYTAKQLKRYFASQFDEATCKQIAAFWEGPVGKKLVKTQVQMLTAGEASQLVFTPKEKALMKRFDATKAGQAFLEAMPQIEETFAEYMKNTQMRMREQFMLNLDKKLRQEPPKPSA
ncbi:DUF2059 domain-containing protein [Noviherbaspirillum sedimenti]|nr:DUF2059 domain-containing protein [Noviherbaspirillum sedimenti]